jgi:hypothetical protein
MSGVTPVATVIIAGKDNGIWSVDLTEKMIEGIESAGPMIRETEKSAACPELRVSKFEFTESTDQPCPPCAAIVMPFT